jgi:hypothetical protein
MRAAANLHIGRRRASPPRPSQGLRGCAAGSLPRATAQEILPISTQLNFANAKAEARAVMRIRSIAQTLPGTADYIIG